MARSHASHDWSPTGWCYGCACHVLGLEAPHPCKPSTDDSRPCDTEAPEMVAAEIDWLAINRGSAAV
jgi:hypothetical protein